MKTHSGTTVFSVITKHGITIGADSFTRHHDGHIEGFGKLMAIGNTVIACEGLGMIKPDGEGEYSYRADQWMTEIKSNLPSELNAEILARSIETGHPFIHLSRAEEMRSFFYNVQANSGKGYLADFFVASAFGGMLLLQVRATAGFVQVGYPPQCEVRVSFDKTTHFNGKSPVNPFVRYGTGKLAEIDKAFSGNGERYQEMLVRTNGSFGRLLNGNEASLDELRDIVRCAISLEAKANPEQVGPPFVVATLQTDKPVSVTSYKE